MVGREPPNVLAGRIRSLFNGRSTISGQTSPSVVSPQSPAPRLGLSILSSPTIDLPGLPSPVLPSSRAPASPHSADGVTSPVGITIAAPPSARSRQSHSIMYPPPPALPTSGRSSPQTNWEWEHVRDSSGSTQRRRRRKTKHGRPPRGAKSIFREKAGRMKLIRCLGLGSLLAVGLTICKLVISFEKTHTYSSRSGAILIKCHQRFQRTHLHDSHWPCSGHGIRTCYDPALHVYSTSSTIPDQPHVIQRDRDPRRTNTHHSEEG